jgi:hypothetical protein
MRTIVMILLFTVSVLLLGLGVRMSVWFIEMPETISSNETITIRFGWRITESLTTNAALRFYENASAGGGVVAYSPPFSLSEGSGENIIIWKNHTRAIGFASC